MIRFETEEELPRELVPKQAVWAIAALLACVLALALVGRTTGIGVVSGVTPTDPGALLAERSIVFGTEGPSGVPVTDADSGELLVLLPPGEGGFMRGVLRPLARERMIRSASPAAPYHLEQWHGGRLTLTDPVSGVIVDLHAFGQDNAGAFAALLPSSEPGASTRAHDR